VPFVARYRKERTGDLDEVQLRQIAERHQYLTELDDRRQTVLSEIAAQGKAHRGVKTRPMLACQQKTELETSTCPTDQAPHPRHHGEGKGARTPSPAP
jgi:uncharacterized protein